MAHVSLQAQDCRIFIKGGKIRFQAIRHDFSGEEIDRVTIILPLKEAYKFSYIENLDKESALDIADRKHKNRWENIIISENQE